MSKLTIEDIYNALSPSYKNIDFRAALYKKNGECFYIVSVFRFSNKSSKEIKNIYSDLNINKYKTENFKIIGKVLKIREWIKFWEKIQNSVKNVATSKELKDLSSYINTKRSSSAWISEIDRSEYNSVQFNCLISNLQKHHNEFKSIRDEVKFLDGSGFYDIIYRTLQINNYSDNSQLFSTFIFPIYIKIEDLDYNNNRLSCQIIFHKIYQGSKFFFTIYSTDHKIKENWKGEEDYQLNINGDDTQELNNDYFKAIINIDFSKYNSDPHFNIKFISHRSIPIKDFLINFDKSFRLDENGDFILNEINSKYLAKKLDKIIESFPANEDISYRFIAQKLNIENEKSVSELGSYIIDKNLSEFSLYEVENGLRKKGSEQLKHQLAIFDTPNQRAFFKSSYFEIRLNELENFILSKNEAQIQIFKYAFITENILRENKGGINFLHNNSGLNLIYSLKEKPTDVDAKINTFVNEITILYSKKWNTIYIISSDSDIVEFFLKTFKASPSTTLYFITDQDDYNLKSNTALETYEQDDFKINIYIKKESS